ncbi:MAG: GntR family transcriptional regulator [Pseudonocardia sp.]
MAGNQGTGHRSRDFVGRDTPGDGEVMPANRWRAIADDLRRRIEHGEWTAGDVLLTQRDLMREYDTTAQGTVARALSALINEGVLIADPSAPRRGTRVRSQHRVRRDLIAGMRMEYAQAEAGEGRGVGLFEQLTGATPDTFDVVISYESAAADPTVAGTLGLPEG